MGGFGALYVGMRNPEIFNSLYVLAPAIHSDYERFVEVINSGDRIRNCINYIESLYSDTTLSPIGQIDINLISQSLLVLEII